MRYAGSSFQRGEIVNGTASSLRSAFVHFRAVVRFFIILYRKLNFHKFSLTQSTRNSKDKAGVVQIEEGIVMLQVENDIPITDQPSATGFIHSVSTTTAQGTEPTSSSINTNSNDIPIPIFTSSQYSIQSKRTRSGSSKVQYYIIRQSCGTSGRFCVSLRSGR